MTTLSVGFLNFGPAKASEVDRLAALADVLCFAEGSDQKKTLKAFVAANPGWLLYSGWRPGAAAVPVLVNTTVTGLPFRVTFHRAVGRRRVGPKGAGPTFSKPKWITHVELADGTHILNTHMIPSATRKDLPKRETEKRRKHYRDHIAAIVAVVAMIRSTDLDAHVVLTLDMNADVDFDLVKPLRAIGFTGWTTKPTMHGKAIDHVLHLADPAFIETEHAVLDTTSDHKAVVATFEATQEEPPMGRMPDVTWAGEQSPRRPMARYDVVCVHTIVGFAPAHAAHFSTRADGEIIQSRSTEFQSGANLDGNHRVIAIENEDHGPAFPTWTGSNVPRLTDEQVEACARILAWAHKEHGIPLQLCPDSRPGSRGLAYHRQGIDGNFGSFDFPGRVSGGEVWTTSFGKVCPGDRRIHQLPDILAAAERITQGDDMPLSDADLSKVRAIVADEVGKAVRFQIDEAQLPDPTGEKHAWSLATLLWNIKRLVEPKP